MKTPDRSDYSKKVEATAGYTAKLDNDFSQLYPFVDGQQDENYGRFIRNELAFVSFTVGSPIERRLLTEGLKKAINKEDLTTRARHAEAKHTVFPDAVEKLIEFLANPRGPTVERRFQQVPVVIEHKGIGGFGSVNERILAPRLIVETPRFSRETYEPAPFFNAKKITGNERDEIREVMKERGMPFAVLTSLYRKLDKNTIFKYLGNQQFITENDLKRRLRGVILQDKYRGDNERHVQVLQNILNENTTRLPFSQDSYQKALDYIVTIGWATQQEREILFPYIKVNKTPYARGVFQGGFEVAHKIADKDFKDPEKSSYIEKKYFGRDKKIITTRLLTAFLVFD